jgi:hypothetical protein
LKLKILILVHYQNLIEKSLKLIVIGQHHIYLKVFKIIIHLLNPVYNIKFEHLKNLLNVLMVCLETKKFFSFYFNVFSLEPLYKHLKNHHIEFLQFAFRWMNNLLMRELPVRCTIRLWDTYLVCIFIRKNKT